MMIREGENERFRRGNKQKERKGTEKLNEGNYEIDETEQREKRRTEAYYRKLARLHEEP